MNQYQQSQRRAISTVTSLIIVLAVAVAAGFYLYNQNKPDNYNAANNGVYSNPSNSERTAEIGNDLKSIEQSDPTKYFQLVDVENNLNLANEVVMKGTIVCTSSLARFKDVTIAAFYCSESNTLLGTERILRDETWGPDSRVTYEFKRTPPEHTRKVNVQIFSAVPTE